MEKSNPLYREANQYIEDFYRISRRGAEGSQGGLSLLWKTAKGAKARSLRSALR